MAKTKFNHTPSTRQEDEVQKWYHIDAEGLVPGRLASEIANMLKGKNSPQYTPHNLSGNHVVVTNLDKLKFTGNKMKQEKIYRHTQRFGALKETLLETAMEKDASKVFLDIVKCMLQKTRQRRNALRSRLFLYNGPNHLHHAQQPVTITV